MVEPSALIANGIVVGIENVTLSSGTVEVAESAAYALQSRPIGATIAVIHMASAIDATILLIRLRGDPPPGIFLDIGYTSHS